ncbi:hypothetical protein ASPWEDRAFT_715572 [Aspergillus wentii DTO 134E9]|uniref:MARVEL domain-containing protein n=1 Tax=Aspergillus wentii DTO 134E9 TaxID=1073089 RepID=A0A1L9R6H6_ASPWE|nr:uncharacterized protein ASPWEDRAFT_715572 [Aspergillus wentii DTO 134E9]KAI9926842.1 hypothetical protein MW887_003939 [Aspergillus wentii]OJJ30488.1 hypothetical protein ASPWEDRAFT_715572 [Aspergillus wentii DTO 134E9]
MRSKSINVKPSLYPALPFHIIRAVSFIATLIVGIILAVFIYHLHTASHKLPWTFLVLVITAGLSLLNLVFTTIIHCCYGLSPRLSLTFNGICLFLWLLSLGLLSWSMYQTILTTCTATYWATSTGITVCKIYKVLFSFTAIAVASHIAACVLDIVVRNRQTRLGEYDPMASNPMLGEVKLQDRSAPLPAGPPPEYLGPHLSERYHNGSPEHLGPHPSERFHDDDEFHDIPEPAHAHAAGPPGTAYGGHDTFDDYHAGGEAQGYYQPSPVHSRQGTPRVRFDAVSDYGYNHPPEQTSYDPAAYR